MSILNWYDWVDMTKTDFLYAVPPYDHDLSHQANVAIASGSMASRLVQEQRSRTVHPDGRNENVSEHSHMLSKVAYALACDMYPQLDRGKVVLYATLHDDVEAYVGDTPTHSISREDRAAKMQRERAALAQLIAEWTPIAPEYAVSTAQYEEQEEAEARFVRVVDKIMTLLIHLPNNGAQLREHWSLQSYTDRVIEVANDLYAEYPEYGELINVRTEIGMYLARKYFTA